MFLQVFSFSLWVVFSFLTLLFPEQNFWILMKSAYYFFQGSCLLNVSKKLSPYPRSSRFSPRLSSRIFVVMYFIFRSLIHFVLIFMKYVKFVSRLIFFFFLHVAYLVVPAPFAEKTIFIPSYYLNSINDQLTLFMWVYFWTFYSVSLICLHFANTALPSWL